MTNRKVSRKKATPVVIVWLLGTDTDYASVLTCREGVRVFLRDRLDGRCGNPPWFKSWDDAARWMVGEGGGPLHSVQLDLDEARRVGILAGECLARFYDDDSAGVRA